MALDKSTLVFQGPPTTVTGRLETASLPPLPRLHYLERARV